MQHHASARAALTALALTTWAATQSLAGTVTVVTSFPKELTQAYKAAFEKANPDIKLEILNKNTVQGIAYVRELPVGQRPDVFWASAPDAFEVLAGQKLLDNVADLANKAAPAKVGNYPINDPKGLYLGQALAGYGLMWNTRYMAANKLPAPRAMGRPDQAGLLRPCGDEFALALGHHPPDGRDDAAGRRLGQGLVAAAADRRQQRRHHRAQLRRARRRQQRPVRHRPGDRLLRPGRQVLGLPGRVRLPRRDRGGAGQHRPRHRRQERRPRRKKFIRYTRVAPKASSCCSTRRSRACRSCRPRPMGGKVPAGYPNPFEIAKRAKVQFDSDLSESRYNVVSAMFDQTITFRLKELQAATKAIHAAEAALAKKPNAKAAALLKQARDLAFSPVVGSGMAGDKEFLALFTAEQEGRRGQQAGHRPGRPLEHAARAATTSVPRTLAEQALGMATLTASRADRHVAAADARAGRCGAAGCGPASGWPAALVLAFLLLFLVLPVARVFFTAFVEADGSLTLGHFEAFFAQGLMREAFFNSLYVAVMSAAVRGADRGAAGLLHGALRVPRRDPDPDPGRAAADHAALRRRGGAAADLRPLGLAQPAAATSTSASRCRSWKA